MAVRIPIIVSAEEKAEWQAEATKRRMTLSELIRQATRKEINS